MNTQDILTSSFTPQGKWFTEASQLNEGDTVIANYCILLTLYPSPLESRPCNKNLNGTRNFVDTFCCSNLQTFPHFCQVLVWAETLTLGAEKGGDPGLALRASCPSLYRLRRRARSGSDGCLPTQLPPSEPPHSWL